ADEITWDEKTLRAKGHILVIQDGLRVTAERAEMDRKTHLGTFYKAAGTARLTDGWFSTCVQANPRWDFRGSSGTVTLNKRMLLRNAVLRVKGVPVMYLPLIYYPMGEDDRSTGFLIPQYETSTVQGRGVKNTFFWAINRS